MGESYFSKPAKEALDLFRKIFGDEELKNVKSSVPMDLETISEAFGIKISYIKSLSKSESELSKGVIAVLSCVNGKNRITVKDGERFILNKNMVLGIALSRFCKNGKTYKFVGSNLIKQDDIKIKIDVSNKCHDSELITSIALSAPTMTTLGLVKELVDYGKSNEEIIEIISDEYLIPKTHVKFAFEEIGMFRIIDSINQSNK